MGSSSEVRNLFANNCGFPISFGKKILVYQETLTGGAKAHALCAAAVYLLIQQKNFRITSEVPSSQYENRTRVFAVRGRRLNPLTNWPCKQFA